MMSKDKENTPLILALLPGQSNKTKLGNLIKDAKNFGLIYSEVESEPDEYQNVDGNIDSKLSSDTGKWVGHEVVAFLESLRDAER